MLILISHQHGSRGQKVLLHPAVVSDKWFVVGKNNELPEDHVGLVSARGTFALPLATRPAQGKKKGASRVVFSKKHLLHSKANMLSKKRTDEKMPGAPVSSLVGLPGLEPGTCRL
jgi:hypothetical protein